MPLNEEHLGSTLEELLEEDGTLEEVTKEAKRRVRVYLDQKAAEEQQGAVHETLPSKRVAAGT